MCLSCLVIFIYFACFGTVLLISYRYAVVLLLLYSRVHLSHKDDYYLLRQDNLQEVTICVAPMTGLRMCVINLHTFNTIS